jgi:hypothetical protein
MSERRDPAIMAIDHCLRAIKKSTPRMLKANLEFVIWKLQKMYEELERKP